jgi:hypothetical protein
MSNIISRWLARQVDLVNRESQDRNLRGIESMNVAQAKMRAGEEISMDQTGRISFELTPAVGGHILTVTRRQAPQQNRGLMVDSDGWNRTTYVIAKEDNLGERISKIINLELIK